MMLHSGQVSLRGEYRIAVVDFKRELRRGETPSCFHLEHRGGQCPHRHDHRVEYHEGRNTIVRSLRQAIVDRMVGNPSPLDLLVTRVATGTSSGPTAQTATQLTTESFRKAPSDILALSQEQVQVYWFFSATEANAGVDLQEHAILAGGATNTPGSGVMLARFLQVFAKDSTRTASGSYTATFT